MAKHPEVFEENLDSLFSLRIKHCGYKNTTRFLGGKREQGKIFSSAEAEALNYIGCYEATNEFTNQLDYPFFGRNSSRLEKAIKTVGLSCEGKAPEFIARDEQMR